MHDKFRLSLFRCLLQNTTKRPQNIDMVIVIDVHFRNNN